MIENEEKMSIIADVQLAAKALQEAGKIELYQKLIEVQETILQVQEENQDLKKKVLYLEEILKIKGSLKYERDSLFEYDGNGKRVSGPYCSRCWDLNKNLIHLHETGSVGVSKCPECKNYVGRHGY